MIKYREYHTVWYISMFYYRPLWKTPMFMDGSTFYKSRPTQPPREHGKRWQERNSSIFWHWSSTWVSWSCHVLRDTGILRPCITETGINFIRMWFDIHRLLPAVLSWGTSPPARRNWGGRRSSTVRTSPEATHCKGVLYQPSSCQPRGQVQL